ncbi:MAG: hypothetical protein U1E17_08405 [Geminicoccaceae bacterium]
MPVLISRRRRSTLGSRPPPPSPRRSAPSWRQRWPRRSRLEGALAARETEADPRLPRAGGRITAEATGLRIEGVGPGLRDPRRAGQDCYIWAAGSALVARIFATLGSAIPQRVIVDGNDVLRSHPFAPCSSCSAGTVSPSSISTASTGCPASPPAGACRAAPSRIGTSISSQFATALLVAAPLAERATVLGSTGEHHSLALHPADRRHAAPLRRAGRGRAGRAHDHGAGRPALPPADGGPDRRLHLGLLPDGGRLHHARPGGDRQSRPGDLQGERAMVEILAGLGAEIAWTAGVP